MNIMKSKEKSLSVAIKAAFTLTGLLALSACGGGGGDESQVTTTPTSTTVAPPPPTPTTPPPPAPTSPPTPNPQVFTIQSAATSFEPLQAMDIVLSSIGSTPVAGSPKYTAQMDISGLGTFAAANTIDVPALYAAGHVHMAAPILEFNGSGVANNTKFSLRVRRESDGAVSNELVLTYKPIEIPTAKRGLPTTTLELITKELLAQSSPTSKAASARIVPGRLAKSAAVLGVDFKLADIQAEAVLRQSFGVSAIGVSLAASGTAATKQETIFSDPSREGHAKATAVFIPGRLGEGARKIVTCLSEMFSKVTGQPSGESIDETEAEKCFDTAKAAVRDDMIPGISEVHTQLGAATTVMTSLAGLGTKTVLGNFTQRVVMQAEMTEVASNIGQITLTIPGVTTTSGDAVDFYAGKATQFGLQKIYDNFVRKTGEFERNFLEAVGAPGAFIDLGTMSVDKLARLADIESSLLTQPSITERLKQLPEQYGGTPLEASTPMSIPLGGSGGQAVTPPTDVNDAKTMCARYPEAATAAVDLGFESCESYMAPFFDKTFMATTLRPIMEQLAAAATPEKVQQLTACALQQPLTATCQALIDSFSAMIDRLFAVLHGYESKNFRCDAGYKEYDASSTTRTCIFAPLAYVQSGSQCLAGSRPSPFDVGATAVCVYYSRDYLQTGGTCRANYTKVNFLGADRCRWSSLPIARPAAYSLNVNDGDKATLEP